MKPAMPDHHGLCARLTIERQAQENLAASRRQVNHTRPISMLYKPSRNQGAGGALTKARHAISRLVAFTEPRPEAKLQPGWALNALFVGL